MEVVGGGWYGGTSNQNVWGHNYTDASGAGGSGYIGGVTNGEMTLGGNTGNGKAKITQVIDETIVTYDYGTNGGTSATKQIEGIEKGTNADLSVRATKQGWEHIGWNTDPNATVGLTNYIPNEDDVTLYAIYQKTLTGTFIDYEGSTRTTRTQNVTIYNKQTSGNITAPNGNTYTGWNWRGWGRAGITTGNAAVGIANGENITLTDNATYYGLYQQDITLTYNGNGGTTPTAATKIRYFNSSGNYVNPSITITNTIPVRKGYTFLNKWTTNINGTGNSYTKGQAYSFSANQTVYAQWKLTTHNINGQVSWNDQENKYNSRPENVTITLKRTPTTGTVTNVPNPKQVSGNTPYSFNEVQTYDTTTGSAYNYTVSQNQVPGYKTTINGYNITNKLIVPIYESKIEYKAIDTYENRYLKNGKVKIKGTIENKNDLTYDKLGLNNAEVKLKIDEEIELEEGSIKISYTKQDGTKQNITTYRIENNEIIIDFGEDKNTKVREKVEIEIEGKLKSIKEYTSIIKLEGKLTSYNGEKTEIDLGELTKTEGKIEAKYQMPKAKIVLTKKDSITEENLDNAEFVLYEQKEETKEYIRKETLENKGNGIYESKEYEWNKESQGKYKIKEEGIPQNHKDLEFSMEYTINELKEENYEITPDYENGNYRIAYGKREPDDFDRKNGIVENEPYKIKVSIEKIDSQTKEQIEAEAKFGIYEWNKETKEYEEYISKVTEEKVTMQRQEDGTYESSQWLYYTSKNEGKYRIIEEEAPEGYYGDYKEEGEEKNTYDINIEEIVAQKNYKGQEIDNEGTIKIGNEGEKLENRRTTNKIEITKVDSQNKTTTPQGDASIEGTEYELYAKEKIYHADGKTSNYEEEEGLLYKEGDLVAEGRINKEGKLTFEGLESGKYYIKEKKAGEGYLIDETEYEIDLSYEGEETKEKVVEKTLEEEVKKQAIEIIKLSQKEETEYEELENAGFSIYKIKDLKIVETGKIEKITKDRYKLKDEEAKRDPYITVKQQEDGNYKLMDLIDYYYKRDYKEGEEEEQPSENGVYHPYNLEGEEKVKNYENGEEGEEIEELKTGKDGKVRSPKLAYGEYIILETSVPVEKQTARPFIVTIEENKEEAQKIRYIIDPDFKTKIKINKKDKETKQNVIGKNAKYVIRNLETGKLETKKTWVPLEGYIEQGTEENPYETGTLGYLITPVELGIGKYQIEEQEAPEGYVLNGYEGKTQEGRLVEEKQGKIQFEVIGNAAYHIDEYLGETIIVQNQENQAQVGTIEIETKGEHITKIDTTNKEEAKIEYEEKGIEGAKYEIIAEEKILSQDRQTVIYEKGETVQTAETNEEGKAYLENIPQGKYKIKQTKAGEGFVRNNEEKEITIKYGTNEKELEEGTNEWKEEAMKTPVKYYKEEYKNERQKLEIEIEKEDSQTKEKLEGATIGIYANERIKGKNGETIVEKDVLIEEKTSNKEGKITYNKNLPLGEYYLKEEKAPTGYSKKEEKTQIDGKYQQDEKEKIEIKKKYYNEKTKLEIAKIGEEGEKIEGATLEIQDQQGNIVEKWETKKEETKEIKGLETNKQYKLVETKPAKGYVTAGQINFKINEEGNIEGQGEKETNKIEMIDKTTKLEIELQDKETKEKLEGITLEIYKITTEKNAEGKEETKEEKIKEIKTGEETNKIEKLEIGNYVIKQPKEEKEKLQEEGYVSLEDYYFEIEDNQETKKITLEQDYTKIEIEVTDEETKEKIKGAKLEIYKITKEEVEEGKEGTKEEKIREFETKEENYKTTKLGVGKYKIKQPKEQGKLQEQGYVTIEDYEFEVKDESKTQKIEIKQKATTLEIEVVDKETKEKLEGIKVEIYKAEKETNEKGEETNKKGEKVGEIETGEGTNKIRKLGIGKYIIEEPKGQKALLDKGYITAKAQEIEIKDEKEAQKAEIEQDYTKIEIEVQDKETKETIEGATIQIIDEEGKAKTEEQTITKENNKLEKIPVGKLKIKETKAPTEKGYVKSEEQEIEIKETEETQKYIYKQDYTKIKIKAVDKETKKELEGIEIKIIKEKEEETKEALNENKTQSREIKRLGVGTYEIETTKEPYGYKKTKRTIEIKEEQKTQEKTIEIDREEFDIKIEEWVKKIERNGKTEYENKTEEQKMKKIDIKDQKIGTEEIKVTYKIRIKNESKITGEVGKIEVNIPQGMKYEAKDNKSYWKEEEGKVKTTGLRGRNIRQNEQAEIEITLRWKNGIENFGTKEVEAKIEEVTSNIGFEEQNKENNKAKTQVIIGVSTGEKNLVYMCWILLISLIILEIYISRKAKIKKFAIKDKTLKYKK